MNLKLELFYYNQHLRKAQDRDEVANKPVQFHLLGSQTIKLQRMCSECVLYGFHVF